MIVEGGADPDQIVMGLSFQRDARPYAGMAEEEIAE